MPTPIFFTGWEHGNTPAFNGNGMFNDVSSPAPTIDSTIKYSGNYSMKIVAAGSACYCRKLFGGSRQIAVGRIPFYIPTGGVPTLNNIFAGFVYTTYTNLSGLHITNTGHVKLQMNPSIIVDDVTISLDAWHVLDYRLDITTSNWTMEWKIDGVTKTTGTITSQPTNDNIMGFRFGTNNAGPQYTIYFDDAVFSETSGDYPIGPAQVELLKPAADGTHNAGTNVMEDESGNDIGAVTAYDKINSVPLSVTNYLRQSAIGASNYAEVLFSDVQSPHSQILGAIALMAYTSETTQTNKGAAIISKDDFASQVEIFGTPATPVDYSDGSTASPYWKSVLIPGVTSTALANALKARLGYSTDATPRPYWLDLYVEVLYVPDTGTINLDLVTYTSTPNAITVTENEVIPLDLVNYTSTPNAITVTENILIPLDLVAYSNTIYDLTILENDVVLLDLVSTTSSVNDFILLENEVVALDLVSYSFSNPEIVVLENVVEDLDLVTYSNTLYEVDLLQEGDLGLDTAMFSNHFFDITVLENEIVELDLVFVSSVLNEIELLESEVLSLDLVTYSSSFDAVCFTAQGSIIIPIQRVFAIKNDSRTLSINERDHVFSIEKTIRIYSIDK